MTAFDRKGLQAFLNSTEGEPPPVFAGRQDVLEAIERAGRMAWKGEGAWNHGCGKSTVVIQGAPGAGKSSILAELQSRSLAAAGRAGEPRVLSAVGQDICENLPSVIMAVAAAGGLSAKRWRKFFPRGLSIVGSIGIAGLSAELNWSQSEPPADLLKLKERFQPEKWKAPVIITVDEAQRLPRYPYAPHARFFQRLHDGDTGLPLTLVLAGLSDTVDGAEAMKLTHGFNIHDIGSLEADEVTALLHGFCDRFALDSEGCEERLEQFAHPCEGWPRHLHFALQALSREVLETDEDLRFIDWWRTENRAAESRARYYNRQRSAELREAKGLTAAVMLAIEPGMDRGDLLAVIESSERDEPGFRIPGGMDRSGFLHCLTHQGALQMTESGALVSPIPSFRAHLIAADGGPAPTAQRPRFVSDMAIKTARRQIQQREFDLLGRTRSKEFLRQAVSSAESRVRNLRADLNRTGFFAFRRKARLRRELETATARAEEARHELDGWSELPPLPKETRDRAARPLTAERWQRAAEERRLAIEEAARPVALPPPAPLPDSGAELKRDDDSPSPM